LFIISCSCESSSCHLAVAGLRQVLDLVEHAFEIALAHLLPGLRHVLRHVRIALRALGEFAQEFVHRLAQLLHEPVDLLVAGTVLERLLQRLLRLAQPSLGSGQVAFLDGQRHLPEIIGDLAQLVVAFRQLQPRAPAHDAEIVRGVVERVLGAERDRVDQLDDVALAVGVKRKDAPELDDRLGQRIAERAFRQHEGLHLAACLLAGAVGRLQRQLHCRTGPDMLGQITRRFRCSGLAAAAWQRQRHFRRLVERPCIGSRRLGQRELGAG
jgi:hypothetical protein